MPFKSLEHPATAKDKGPPECTHCCSSSVMNHSRTVHCFRLQLRIKINLDPPLESNIEFLIPQKKTTTIVHSTSNSSVTKFYPTVQISYTKTMPRLLSLPMPCLQRTHQVSTPGHPLQRSSPPECFRMFFRKKSFLFRTTTPKCNMCNIGP